MSRPISLFPQAVALSVAILYYQGLADTQPRAPHSPDNAVWPPFRPVIDTSGGGEEICVLDPNSPEIQQELSDQGALDFADWPEEMKMNSAAAKIAWKITRPCCVSMNSERHDCFFRIGMMTIRHYKRYKHEKAQMENLGGLSDSDLGCTSWNHSHIFLYQLGPRKQLVARTLDENSWTQWRLLPAGTLHETPSCRVLSASVIQCMGRSSENYPVAVRLSSGTWKRMRVPAQRIWSPVKCVLSRAGQMDCFAVGDDSGMRHFRWTPKTGWKLQRSLGGFCQGTPSPVVIAPGRITVFVNSSLGRLAYKSYDGREWSGWDLRTLWGDVLYTDAECVRSTRFHVDCFVGLGPDGRLHRVSWNGFRWSRWLRFDSIIADKPICRYFDDGRIWCLLLATPPKWTLRAFRLLNFTSIDHLPIT